MNRPLPLLLAGLLVSLLCFAGCSTTPAATKKDLSVLQPGVSRATVIDELGKPVSSTVSRAGLPVDVFTFVQGTKPSPKPPRPVEPEQADAVEIMALMEQSGYSPTSLLTGKKITLQLNYDTDERVINTVVLRME